MNFDQNEKHNLAVMRLIRKAQNARTFEHRSIRQISSFWNNRNTNNPFNQLEYKKLCETRVNHERVWKTIEMCLEELEVPNWMIKQIYKENNQ